MGPWRRHRLPPAPGQDRSPQSFRPIDRRTRAPLDFPCPVHAIKALRTARVFGNPVFDFAYLIVLSVLDARCVSGWKKDLFQMWFWDLQSARPGCGLDRLTGQLRGHPVCLSCEVQPVQRAKQAHLPAPCPETGWPGRTSLAYLPLKQIRRGQDCRRRRRSQGCRGPESWPMDRIVRLSSRLHALARCTRACMARHLVLAMMDSWDGMASSIQHVVAVVSADEID